MLRKRQSRARGSREKYGHFLFIGLTVFVSLPPPSLRSPHRSLLALRPAPLALRRNWGICSPLWGRSHTDGCSEGPSRPGGGDYAGCCLPLAGVSFRFASLPLRRQRSSGSPHQARMAIGPSSKGLLHHLPVFWSGLRPSLHPSFFFNFRNFGCRLIEKPC